jgi:hypothetical protein
MYTLKSFNLTKMFGLVCCISERKVQKGERNPQILPSHLDLEPLPSPSSTPQYPSLRVLSFLFLSLLLYDHVTIPYQDHLCLPSPSWHHHRRSQEHRGWHLAHSSLAKLESCLLSISSRQGRVSDLPWTRIREEAIAIPDTGSWQEHSLAYSTRNVQGKK